VDESYLDNLAPVYEAIPEFAKVGQRVGHNVGQTDFTPSSTKFRRREKPETSQLVIHEEDLNIHALRHRNLKPAGRCRKPQVAGITCTKVHEEAGKCRKAHSRVAGWARMSGWTLYLF
jgi:hypothetical protein